MKNSLYIFMFAFALYALFFNVPSVKAQEELNNEHSEPFIVPPLPDFSQMRLYATEQVEAVIDPIRIRLNDGRIVQMPNLDIPDMNAYDSGEIGQKAAEELENLLADKTIKLYQVKDAEKGRQNRMGHDIVHVVIREGDEDKIWLNGYMLVNGLARLMPMKDNTDMASVMRDLERDAITHKRGLWADEEHYKLYTPIELEDKNHSNEWIVAEGIVNAAAMVNNTTYLNFGDNWRNDFTIAIKPDVRRDLSKQNVSALNLARKKVRVHGWLEQYNGPYIELIDPVWLEVLPDENEATMMP